MQRTIAIDLQAMAYPCLRQRHKPRQNAQIRTQNVTAMSQFGLPVRWRVSPVVAVFSACDNDTVLS
ncbi:hypothetical protein [Alicycliphilus denitrificans]|uniref:hypothetical protein n=1 Tax=Alicycliphilus denitrificans TaxID=179636 RepID=UPI00384BE8D3